MDQNPKKDTATLAGMRSSMFETAPSTVKPLANPPVRRSVAAPSDAFLPPKRETPQDYLIQRNYRVYVQQDKRIKKLARRQGLSENEVLRHLLETALDKAEEALGRS